MLHVEKHHLLARIFICKGFENDANLPSLKSLNSWSKSNQHLSSKFLHIDCGSEVEEKFKNAKSSNLNKSTLSLHITAYENLSEASNEFSSENEEEEGMKNERAGSNKKWEIMKQFSADSQSKTEVT
uniref:Uncharacterized protein n=1 Tax=Panagrolaimus sp. ES5 TaxID=591445 RepID=A0AC34F2P4_9BILA